MHDPYKPFLSMDPLVHSHLLSQPSEISPWQMGRTMSRAQDAVYNFKGGSTLLLGSVRWSAIQGSSRKGMVRRRHFLHLILKKEKKKKLKLLYQHLNECHQQVEEIQLSAELSNIPHKTTFCPFDIFFLPRLALMFI